MLSHLKAREATQSEKEVARDSESAAVEAPAEEVPSCGDNIPEETRATCEVLCSLGASSCSPEPSSNGCMDDATDCSSKSKQWRSKTCPRQHQLPMFLSKTYHMIDRCDPSIATWSDAGDNFVVKDVEKFASHVLPLYFKHSNFSSFARQLNFYGFRKLRSDPILTSDVNPNTACYVRFYHEKFQKDRPELLHEIKRATKSDQQSKDDVDSLKHEVGRLRDCIGQMSTEMDRKLTEMKYEYNRRITALSSEYDKLTTLVTQILARGQLPEGYRAPCDGSNQGRVPDLMHSLSQVAAMSLQSHLRLPSASAPPSSLGVGDGNTLGGVAAATLGTKRPAPEEDPPAENNRRQRKG